MNKRQREIQQEFLNNEKAVLKKLEAHYEDALDEINSKIELLLARQDADMQHVIYQVEYQKALKTQVKAILEQLQANEFSTVSEYLARAYEDGFVGTMYDLQGQGIPLIFPIDQRQVVAAVQHETKLSQSLYTTLGKDVADLQKKIAGEITRGIAGGQMYSEIARNISSWAMIPKNNAMRIARTEAHRIQSKATADAQFKAKEKGADVVKQWDSTMDRHTRKSHRKLDGQIRELEEPFEVNGHKAMHPGGFGVAKEDINCRCAILQRARWNLGSDYTKWDADAPIVIDDDGTTQFVVVDAKSFREFKGYYKDITGQMTMNFQGRNAERVRRSAQKIKSKNTLENTGKSSTMKLDDIVFHKSVGAKISTYEVMDLETGEMFRFAEGSRLQDVEVFAGKGASKPYIKAYKYADAHGGKIEDWQHVKGKGTLDTDDGYRKAEVHWSQCDGIGRFDFFVKKWLE